MTESAMNQSEDNENSDAQWPTPEDIQQGRNEAFAAIDKNQEEYDKQLLTLSSGLLAVSLAFIKDVVPVRGAEFLWVLYISFALLTCCILLVLLSYRSSIRGHFKVSEYWDSQASKKKSEFPYKDAERMKLINRFSGVPFFLGVLLLVLFVILNLSHEANMPIDRNAGTKDGAYLRTPPSGTAEDRGAHIKVPVPPPPPAAPTPKSGGSAGNNQTGKP